MTIIEQVSTDECRSGPLPYSPARDSVPADVHAPGRQLSHVARPHLLSRLDARHARLTVVSTPAGWGKTTLLASWTHRQRGRAVWVTGGSGAGFWDRVTAAVATNTPILSEAGATADPRNGPARLAGMLEEMSSPLAIVVDDCNDVAGPGALADLAQVVRTSSAPVRLVLACRGAPALPLHQWRMDRQLLTLGQDELAFSIDEAAGLFAGQQLALPRSAVVDLHARTEGWAAGLQLVATALADRTDGAQAALDAGPIDLIADYLGAEVLARLDPLVRSLLVEASVAENLTAGLLNTLTDRLNGAAVLADLQRRGAFVRRSPTLGDWYRLHPMLSQVLYRELTRHNPDRAGQAHRRAADWHLIQGPPVEALRHLLAAREWELAADVLHRHWPDIAIGSRRLGVGPVVTSVPGPDAPAHVVLAMAAERLDAGDTASARHLIHLAEADPDQGERASITTALRLAAARLDGDLNRVSSTAFETLTEPVPEFSAADRLRPRALLSLGAAKLQLGELTEAGRYLGEARILARRRDLDQVQISATSHLAAWYAALGHLHDAVRTAREALEMGGRLGLGQLSDLSWSRLALAEAYFQWDRLGDAWCCTDAALDSSCGDRLINLTGTILQTRIRVASGQLTEAHDALRAAYHESGTADLPASARRAFTLAEAELRLACGDPAGAHERLRSWPDEEPLPAQAAVVEGSVLLVEGRPAAASIVVAPYLTRPDPGTSLTCRACAGLVAALAGKATGDREKVMHGLEVALKVADEEGHRRCFTAGGHAVLALIESVAPAMSAYPPVVAALAGTFDPLVAEASASHLPVHQNARPTPTGTLVEPLTSRERTVLRYLQSTQSHVEIAALLYISVNTVKTHVKNIYRKLGADRRKEAVRLARELRLL